MLSRTKMALILPLICGMLTPLALAQLDASLGKTRPSNVEPGAMTRAAGLRSAPTKTGTAETFSGISGPGQAVEGSGGGGYRSGNDGVMYRGPDPKPGWKEMPSGRCTGSEVAAGLLPPLKPIWDLHLRDTSICYDQNGNYYMTGSSGDNIWDINDGIELWHSTDLQKWDYLGLVWSIDKDGTWEKKFRRLWAPEVHFINKTFYLTYCMQGGGTGILASKSGKAEGPYANPIAADAPLSNQIDATLFGDDDGKIYFTAGAGSRISLMKADMSGVDHGFPTEITLEQTPGAPTRLGHEGVSLFKANGHYYLTAADTIGGRYSSVAGISDSIAGPYTHVRVAVPSGAGGNYFQDKEGKWFCTLFGNDDQCSWREKPGIVEISFDQDHLIEVAAEQPAFILQAGSDVQWKKAAATKP